MWISRQKSINSIMNELNTWEAKAKTFVEMKYVNNNNDDDDDNEDDG